MAGTSPSASYAPSASATRAGNAPRPTWGGTSMLRKAVGGYLAGASTKSSPASCSRPPTSPGAGGARATHHRRAARRGSRRRRFPAAAGPEPRPPTGRRQLPGGAPPPPGRGGTCRTVGHGEARTARPARTVGHCPVVARRRRRPDHRAHGMSGFGAHHPAPAGRSAPGELPGTDFETMGPMRTCPAPPMPRWRTAGRSNAISSTARWGRSACSGPSPRTI